MPDGMSPDARETWPSRELIDSFLGNFPHDVEVRPGETVQVDNEEEQARARLFRDVLGQYCSGVTVVTTVLDGKPEGLTCQSFTSVSLDPPLVAFLPTKQSRAFAAIRRSGHFCVNFLADGQEGVSNAFASRNVEDKFAGVDWTVSQSGSALLGGAVGYVDCTVHQIHEAGDHYIVLGKVVDLGVGGDVDPLLYFRGKYRSTNS
ncbi:MAG: flavin reductase family protein [Nocardioides sp.]|uniref:flavin reductase family protein n=1 Tax=Nocardioides sp. TaxID=35761 RepID=UPI003F05E596